MAFPTVQGRDRQVSPTSDSTSWAIPFPVEWGANLAGDRIYAFVSVDQEGVDSDSVLSTATGGWSLLASEGQARVRGAIFAYDVGADNEAIPGLVVDSSSAQQFSSVALWLRSSTGMFGHFAASAEGSSANSDPPQVTNNSGGSIDALVIATRHGDALPTPTAPPAGYANWQNQPSAATAAAGIDKAEREVALASGASENPGSWTVTSEQWVCWTLAVYESTGAAASPAGYVKVWDGSAWALRPVKVWSGSAWTVKPLKYQNGSGWIDA